MLIKSWKQSLKSQKNICRIDWNYICNINLHLPVTSMNKVVNFWHGTLVPEVLYILVERMSEKSLFKRPNEVTSLKFPSDRKLILVIIHVCFMFFNCIEMMNNFTWNWVFRVDLWKILIYPFITFWLECVATTPFNVWF